MSGKSAGVDDEDGFSFNPYAYQKEKLMQSALIVT
jgi:hypothetical protein